MYLLTPPFGQDETQSQFFNDFQQFSFFLSGRLAKTKDPSLPS